MHILIKYIKFYFIVAFFFASLGCSGFKKIMNDGYSEYIQYGYFGSSAEYVKKRSLELNELLGVHKDRIKELYGNPGSISGPGVIERENYQYEERWSYKEKYKVYDFDYDKIVLFLYFNDDKFDKYKF